MNGNESLRKLRRLARRWSIDFELDPGGGKGGHGMIVFGRRRTILRSSRHKEIPSGNPRGMLSDLGINPKDLG